MTFQLAKRGRGRIEIQPAFRQIGDDKIIASTRLDADGRRRERFQVITLRDGKISDMQGFDSHRAAERFARRG